MIRRKVLIIVDHPLRDLAGIAYLTYELISTYQYRAIICGTRNEIRNLVRHRPDLLLMSHLGFQRHTAIIDVAKSLGVNIGVLPTEGLANDPEEEVHLYGQAKHRHRIDLILTWSNEATMRLANSREFPNAIIRATGCPRFDFHTNKRLRPGVTKAEYCLERGLDPEKPIILWASGTSHAHRESDLDYLWEKRLRTTFRSYEFYRNLYSDNTDVLEYSSEMVSKLSSDLGEKTNIVVKPHPQEKPGNHDVLKKNCPNIVFLPHRESFEICNPFVDVLLHFRCTTSYESWLSSIDRPTIHLTLPDIRQPEFKAYIYKGSDVVSDYESLLSLVQGYLSGRKTSPELVRYRRSFIKQYLVANDSMRTSHCAKYIDEFLWNRQQRKQSFSRRLIAEYARHKLFQLCGSNRGKVIRTPLDDDYFDNSRFGSIMDRLAAVSEKTIDKSDYILDF